MTLDYEELDCRRTKLGELVLRRRRLPGLDQDVYEIKLDDELLMSSLLNESELALAHLAIPAVGDGSFHVLIGGLGLGHTAWAALGFDRVRSVTVIELLPEVIEWHHEGRVPLGLDLSSNTRCFLREGDFFSMVQDPVVCGLRPPEHGYGAILVDIDHAPDSWLAPENRGFYSPSALSQLSTLLSPGGVFALWSAGKANEAFRADLSSVFGRVATHEIEVFNPMIDDDQTDTIYVAKKAGTLPIPQ